MTRHQTEGAVYAGQAHMGGAEGMDRATFKKVSEIFNAFVYEPSPAPVQASVQARPPASPLEPPSSSALASSFFPPLGLPAVGAAVSSSALTSSFLPPLGLQAIGAAVSSSALTSSFRPHLGLQAVGAAVSSSGLGSSFAQPLGLQAVGAATSPSFLVTEADLVAFYSRPYPGPGGAFKPLQYCTAAENAAPKKCRHSPSLQTSSPLPTLEPQAVDIASSFAPLHCLQAVGAEAPPQLAPVPSFQHSKLSTLDEDQHHEVASAVATVDLVGTARQSAQNEVLAAMSRRASTLLVQRAGFGKTQMALKLLGPANFVLFLVPLLPLVEQSLADIKKLGYPCADWKDVFDADAASIVGCNSGVVATFDVFPDPALAELLASAHANGKQCYVIVDEVHQVLKDKFRFKFNRAFELSSRLRERNVKVTWLLLSATLRMSDEHPLAAALHVDIDVVLRGAVKPDNVKMVLIQTQCLAEAIQRAKGLEPQIIYVTSYAEARNVTEIIPEAAVWTSRMTQSEKHAAMQHLERGGILVATYGLGIGLNLLVRGRFPSKICALGIPWSAESAVQAAGREREGGIFWIIEWELGKQAKSPIRGLQELATLLLVEEPEAVFQLFEADTYPAALSQPMSVPKYSDLRNNALLAKAFTSSVSWCAICCEPHASSACSKVKGICFTCGSTGHPAKTCQSSRLSQVPPHFDRVFMCFLLDTLVSAEHCIRRVLREMQASAVRRGRCQLLPSFPAYTLCLFSGVSLHGTKFGTECKAGRPFVDDVKMLLLAGQSARKEFGPGTYSDRLVWVHQGTPPNIVGMYNTCLL